MRKIFGCLSAALALLLATPALGASEFDIANAEHDANGGTNAAKRATLVDSAGTSIVGTGTGISSRVESLGTIAAFTTLSASWQLVATSSTIPAWAKSVHAQCVITALNNTGAAAANFLGALVPMVDGTTPSLSSAGNPLFPTGTIVAPVVGSLLQMQANPDSTPVAAGLVTNLAYVSQPWLPRGKVRLYIRTETAPGTSWSVACEWFARG
jgi:hypothetical protein